MAIRKRTAMSLLKVDRNVVAVNSIEFSSDQGISVNIDIHRSHEVDRLKFLDCVCSFYFHLNFQS